MICGSLARISPGCVAPLGKPIVPIGASRVVARAWSPIMSPTQLHQFPQHCIAISSYGICMEEHAWDLKLPHETENVDDKGETCWDKGETWMIKAKRG